MKGALLALCTVITWAMVNVVNRYCVVKFDVNILLFTAFLIFSGGVGLLLIRKKVEPQDWKKGIKYSWLYTIMQIIKSFTLISTYLYITTTEASLLFNLEIIVTYLFVYLIFKRRPHKSDYWGIIVILTGIILFIYSLPAHMRMNVSILILIASAASCIRSIVVEYTTQKNPETSVRQKCGISGYTMTISGLGLIVFFFITAVVKHFIGEVPTSLHFLTYFPDLKEFINMKTIISACIAGFFIDSLSVYLFYATLKTATSEVFMTFRAFQPIVVFLTELIAAIYYRAMLPDLSTKDYILGSIIILGTLLILIVPSKQKTQRSKDFIAQ